MSEALAPGSWPRGNWHGFIDRRLTSGMNEIKVVLANSSHLLQDMLGRTLQKIEGLKVVQGTHSLSQVKPLLKQEDADWLILGLEQDSQIPDFVKQLIEKDNGLSVLAISKSGDTIRVRAKDLGSVEYQGTGLQEFTQLLVGKLENQL